jgi:cell division cycle 20-like protein 1 (cofactor of APC complex)
MSSGSQGSSRDSPSQPIYSDRFIPSRLTSNLEDAFDLMEQADPSNSRRKSRESDGGSESKKGPLNNLIRSELLGQPLLSSPSGFSDFDSENQDKGGTKSPGRRLSDGGSPASSNVLKYKTQKNSRDDTFFSSGSSSMYGPPGSSYSFLMPSSPGSPHQASSLPTRSARKIAKVPFKVLDAPALQDDFYLNLVDWSSSNLLAVGLGSCVYLWSACTSKVTKMCDLGAGDSVTSVTWADESHGSCSSVSQLAVGTNSGKVQIWDAAQCTQVTNGLLDSTY